jgi:hypothetical protein
MSTCVHSRYVSLLVFCVPMEESRVENPDRENRWGIKIRKSRQRKPMGESRVENPDRENRWENQESKVQTQTTLGA